MEKTGLVYCIHPDQYEIFDERIVKPTWYREIENGEIVGSMVLQELDQITLSPFIEMQFKLLDGSQGVSMPE